MSDIFWGFEMVWFVYNGFAKIHQDQDMWSSGLPDLSLPLTSAKLFIHRMASLTGLMVPA